MAQNEQEAEKPAEKPAEARVQEHRPKEGLDSEVLSEKEKEELHNGKLSTQILELKAEALNSERTATYEAYPDPTEETIIRGSRRWTDENGVAHRVLTDEAVQDAKKAFKASSEEKKNAKQ